jgi:hypothetical protein
MDLAVENARKEERMLAHLRRHDEDIKELRVGQAETTAILTGIRDQMGRIETSMKEAAAAAAATAAAAKAVTEKTVTAKQFWLAFGLLLIAAAAYIKEAHGG